MADGDINNQRKRDEPWLFRTYSGHSTAAATNSRTALSRAFAQRPTFGAPSRLHSAQHASNPCQLDRRCRIMHAPFPLLATVGAGS